MKDCKCSQFSTYIIGYYSQKSSSHKDCYCYIMCMQCQLFFGTKIDQPVIVNTLRHFFPHIICEIIITFIVLSIKKSFGLQTKLIQYYISLKIIIAIDNLMIL